MFIPSGQMLCSRKKSLLRLEVDKGVTGFQSLAAIHGEPSQCSNGDNTSVACCVHGMATFPQWHRLYVVQLEQALVERGWWGWGCPTGTGPSRSQSYLA
ncbi:hypothetical protein C0Q70_07467 [Pomacea canaliculata]|uniref:Tyrosinase copper-binding domain-containing protein n=1 Tax=Pomacea canaliculata TaxID=400727 RepID=A0A2T7PF38_POMCA|nr:hypothetical protein C0Q70_07467 [Pomacea canaliculata]